GDDFHVVLDHQDGAPGADLLDELGDAVDVFMAHALRGFVQQHQAGFHGQGGGDFQGALAAVGQVHGHLRCEVGQVDFGEQFHGPVVQVAQAAVAAPEV